MSGMWRSADPKMEKVRVMYVANNTICGDCTVTDYGCCSLLLH